MSEMVSKRREQNVIVNPEPDKITILSGQMFYRALAVEIQKGSRVFVKDMGRKQASYARKTFSKILEKEVVATPVRVDGEGDGYLFQLRYEPHPSAR